MNVLRINAVKMRQGANAFVPEESLGLANHGITKIRHRKHTLWRRSAVLLAMRKQAFCALRSARLYPEVSGLGGVVESNLLLLPTQKVACSLLWLGISGRFQFRLRNAGFE